MAVRRGVAGDVLQGDNFGNVVALPYSASITPDAAYGDYFTITVTNGSAFTINAPVNPQPGRIIAFEILNSSGGAGGAISLNAIFKGTAITAPGNGLRVTVEYIYNGTNWVQLGAPSAAF